VSVLITGFQPFGEVLSNPSEQIAEFFGGITLPVVQNKAFEIVKHRVQQINPTAILMTGLGRGSEKLQLERIAINLDDYPIPDNEGNQPREQKIILTGPAAYFSTLPIQVIHQALSAQSIPVQFSLSAGSYLCNHLFFQVMHFLSENQMTIPAGFIHIPDKMTPEELQSAFSTILSVISEELYR
jgi:pyroglutamyl-peptidase